MRFIGAGLLALIAISSGKAAFGQNSSAPRLIDRLVLQVGSSHYTQRQWECYLLSKRVVLTHQKDKPSDLRVEGLQWERELESFRDDMVLVEAGKETILSNAPLTPTKAMVDTAENLFLQHAKKSLAVAEARAEICPEKSALREALSLVVMAQSYLRRQAQSLGESQVSVLKGQIYSFDTKKPWFQSLISKTPHRFYDGAREAKKLTSP